MPRTKKKSRMLPGEFEPRFWDDVDGRLGIKKQVRQRFEQLKRDSGAKSIQKQQLCQRAAFISIQLETIECIAAEGGEFDHGGYIQAVNALSGLLSKLGLERQAKEKARDLESYLRENGR